MIYLAKEPLEETKTVLNVEKEKFQEKSFDPALKIKETIEKIMKMNEIKKPELKKKNSTRKIAPVVKTISTDSESETESESESDDNKKKKGFKLSKIKL